MKTSEQVELISAALVEMQSESTHANFDSKNPHFKSKYASLAEVIDTAKPVLAKHGLAVIQLPAFRENIGHVLCTRIVHKSGQWIEDEMRLNPIKDDPQGLGSALTYARRYSIPGVCMIASEDDDDGNAASHKQNVSAIQAKAVSMDEVKKQLAALNTEDAVRKFFPLGRSQLNAMRGSNEFKELTALCQARIAELAVAVDA